MSNEIQIAPNPVMQMLAAAVDKGQDASVKELVQILREERDYNAQLEFNQAMNRCQSRMKRISADMENPQTRSRYASYAQLDRTVRPIYTEEGFSLSFSDGDRIDPETLRIVCYLSHSAGHTRILNKDMPVVTVGPQGKAVMTPTHATASAGSYAKRGLLKDIFNLAIGEDDDDGNGGEPKIPREKVGQWMKSLGESTDLSAHMKLWGKIYTTANELGDQNALDILIPAYEAKKAELSGAQ
jgi:hypothetical protein